MLYYAWLGDLENSSGHGISNAVCEKIGKRGGKKKKIKQITGFKVLSTGGKYPTGQRERKEGERKNKRMNE